MDMINHWANELDILKAIIAKTALVETNKWGGCVYVLGNKNIVGVGGFKKFFTLWFFNGAYLKDEKKHLVNANEGVTKSLRQWRFTSKDEINEEEIITYILEAIQNEKEGKIIKPKKVTEPTIIPDLLQKVLNDNIQLKDAFLKFSPYKQKEFIEFIETAKREETKLSRIEKIKPMILDNIGLNDKYR
ncbi:YdeI/OmpD-associated family protein [Flavobacterium marginilacus]|uniref:YdeI/OmpD-associated family protein n=1 Tax=Flavobacterium marginilacus TaxID=3003256 RepID=UPI00248E272D|nr:YdeI/OmpD-associated family protein [Flavobacterium marginilacus]